jgi:tetratricopeptide (TPR) repeat protein
MKKIFVQTENEELISSSVGEENGETCMFFSIGKIHHRGDLKKVIDEMAMELQFDENYYNNVSESYRRALFLMSQCDEYSSHLKFDKVISCCTEANKICPYMIEALRGIADGNFSLGKFDIAIEFYKKILHLNPNTRDINYQLGRCYTEKEKFSQSLKSFYEEIRISGEAADIYLQIGTLWYFISLSLLDNMITKNDFSNKEILSNGMKFLFNAKESFERGYKLDSSFKELQISLENVNNLLNNLKEVNK